MLLPVYVYIGMEGQSAVMSDVLTKEREHIFIIKPGAKNFSKEKKKSIQAVFAEIDENIDEAMLKGRVEYWNQTCDEWVLFESTTEDEDLLPEIGLRVDYPEGGLVPG
jgi:electron transfer flavoprotein alpha subunit